MSKNQGQAPGEQLGINPETLRNRVQQVEIDAGDRPGPTTGDAGVMTHSDKGVQYLAVRYAQRLAEAGAIASVGSTGDSYDCEHPRVAAAAV